MSDLFENPMGLMGFEFVEFASPTQGLLEPIFEQMGFTLIAKHRSKDVVLYRQGGINFIVNREPKSFAGYFAVEHGACACGIARTTTAALSGSACWSRACSPVLTGCRSGCSTTPTCR